MGIEAAPAWGSWAAVSMPELAQDSDAIVVGRLKDLRIAGTDSIQGGSKFTIMRGTIYVERTLWSRLPARDRLIVQWATWSGTPNTDLARIAQYDVLWLLKRDPKSVGELVYHAGYPNCTIELENPQEVEAMRQELAGVSRPGPRVRAMKRILNETAAQLRSGAPERPR